MMSYQSPYPEASSNYFYLEILTFFLELLVCGAWPVLGDRLKSRDVNKACSQQA